MNEIVINASNVTVQKFHEEHVDEIIRLMNQEGWYYYDRNELNRYLRLDQDCFVLVKGNKVIGSLFTTNFGNQAWIGNIIIDEQSRGMGLAKDLISGVIEHLVEHKDVDTFRLGSVPLAIGLYKKVGFKPEAFTTAQEVELPITQEVEKVKLPDGVYVEKLNESDLESISRIDEKFFKSNRHSLLKDLFNNSLENGCFCLKNKDTVVGFLMLRRRQISKSKGNFAEGPDYAYRLGPSSILTGYGFIGFKALFQEAIKVINEEVGTLKGSAKMYVVFPKNADKKEIYADTRELALAMGIDANINLDTLFDEHDHIFNSHQSAKNTEQWKYMKSLGFQQEYFEQIMSYTPVDNANIESFQRKVQATKADSEGIYATATPGDKA